MPSFDFSGIGKKPQASQDYGFLVDSLEILENKLASDGKMSPGDYKLLKQKAQQIYSNPGLTPAQRSNIDVKISRYDRDANTGVLRDTSDIARLNRDIENDKKGIVSAFGNDPMSVIRGNQALLEVKMFRLRNTVEDQERAGDDSSEAQMELMKTQNEWLDSNAALEFAQTYKPGSGPSPDFVLDIETNTRGEIRDVKVSRSGDNRTGYLPTSATLGGFSVRGKVNSKISSQEGKNVFKIGDQTFSAANVLRPGADGRMKADTLVADSQQTALGSRGMTRGTSEYLELTPANLRIQRSSDPGEYIQTKDSIYKDLGDGRYERYVGATKDQLGIDDSDLLTNLPEGILNTVRSNTVKTIDTGPGFMPSNDVQFGTPKPAAPTGPSLQNAFAIPDAASYGAQLTGSPKTPQPTVRAPQTAGGVAKGPLQQAKSFLGSLFGGGE